MQPETIKVNGQTLNGADIVKKELTPVQQWDQLAFQVIYNEICPKGFRKVKNGKYRGSEYVEMPKKAVTRVQRISAQLIRGFREQAKLKVNSMLIIAEGKIDTAKKQLSGSYLWEYGRKRQLNDLIQFYEGQVNAYKAVMRELDELKIVNK